MNKEFFITTKQEFSREPIQEDSNLLLIDLVNIFLKRLSNEGTRTRYYFCFKKIFSEKILTESFTLKDLRKLNLNSRLDSILAIESLSKNSKQTCAAAFLSFFKFLYRETSGFIKAPIPQKTGVSKTFSRVRDKTIYSPMNRLDLVRLIEAAYKHSVRMGVFVEMAIQSTKRLSELLSVKFSDIDWDNNCITFLTLKTQLDKKCRISFPENFMKKLKSLGTESEFRGYIFSTSSGRKIQKDYVWRQLLSISNRCGFHYRVTPHVLRATSISMYRDYGFSLGDLIEITGHSSIEMVRYYDKNSFKNNPSCKVALI